MRRSRIHFRILLLQQFRFLAMALALLPFGMSFSLVVAPMITQAEITENRTQRERSEELTLASRSHHVRQLLIEHPHCGEEWIYPVAPKFTERQNGLTVIFHGHRLSHELLAPMTC